MSRPHATQFQTTPNTDVHSKILRERGTGFFFFSRYLTNVFLDCSGAVVVNGSCTRSTNANDEGSNQGIIVRDVQLYKRHRTSSGEGKRVEWYLHDSSGLYWIYPWAGGHMSPHYLGRNFVFLTQGCVPSHECETGSRDKWGWPCWKPPYHFQCRGSCSQYSCQPSKLSW